MKPFALLALAVPMLASPLVCPPTLSVDGRTVNPACPGISAEIFAYPGSFWEFSFEDISFATQGGGDRDYNDFMGTLAVDPLGTFATVTYTGSFAARWNTLMLSGGALFATNTAAPGSAISIATTPNAEIAFVLKSSDYALGDFYYSMGTLQDWAVCDRNCAPTAVPEPGSAWSLAIGLILLLALPALGDVAHRLQHRRAA